MTGLPRYRDLPKTDEGVGSAWGLWGDQDDIGLMNLLTPEKALEGARAVRTGKVFALDIPLDFLTPPLFGRQPARHVTGGDYWTNPDGPALGLDDYLDGFYPQATSQWDSLGHVGYATDRYWNGRTTAEIRAGRNTVDNIAAKGIATRGVLLDVAAIVAANGGPDRATPITVADLDAARVAAGVEIRPGDVLAVHTGFLDWYAAQAQPERDRIAADTTVAGLAHDEAIAEYLWDLHIAAVVGDWVATETFPVGVGPEFTPFDFMHRVLIGRLGMMLGELWRLGPLARDCAEDGVHEFLLTSAPLPLTAGIGSTANALAIK